MDDLRNGVLACMIEAPHLKATSKASSPEDFIIKTKSQRDYERGEVTQTPEQMQMLLKVACKMQGFDFIEKEK